MVKLIIVNTIFYNIRRLFTQADLNRHMADFGIFRDRVPALFASELVNQIYSNAQFVLYDVGANLGLFFRQSQFFSKHRIVCFEPLVALHDNSCCNITWEPIALSNFTGSSKFYIDNNHTGSSSLIFNKNHLSFIDVKTSKLDDFVANSNDKVSFIKIDVEGATVNVLEGANELIKKHRPIIFAECEGKDLLQIKSLLCDYNLYVLHIPGLSYDSNVFLRLLNILQSLIMPKIFLMHLGNQKSYEYIDNLICLHKDFSLNSSYRILI